MRSRKYGIQPIPPSDNATRRSGKRTNTPDSSRSAASPIELQASNVYRTESGQSSDVPVVRPDVPKCMHSGTPVSSAAANTGSHCRLCQLGRPSGAGFSGKLTAFAPFAAQRFNSSTAAETSHSGRITSEICRSGS